MTTKSSTELAAEHADTQTQVGKCDLQKRRQVIDHCRALILRYHITASELGLRTERKKPCAQGGFNAPAKYRHPQTGEEWTGTGMQPKWFKDALKQYKPDQLVITKPDTPSNRPKTPKATSARLANT